MQEPVDALYPQYTVSVTWPEDNERGTNSTSFDRMFKEDPGAEEVERVAREEWWPKYVENKPDTVKPTGPPVFEVTQLEPESWSLTWFQHWTFDVGQTDAEALASFQRYVDRYAHMQDHPRHWIDAGGYRCLMGAEDRWRWTGAGTDGEADTTSAPPCRCEHCAKQGVIRIGH